MKSTLIFAIVIGLIFSETACRQESKEQGNVKSDTSTTPTATVTDPLPGWNEGPTKKAIIDFVTRTTQSGSPDFVPIPKRIACFDNDGTLWSEQPVYYQVAFGMDEIKALAAKHPEWKKQQPFKAVLSNDLKTILAAGSNAYNPIISASSAGFSTAQYDSIAAAWLANSKHPRFNRPYTDLVYQPMVELLNYLRANGYKTFIVSGGVVDFMRIYSEKSYGIPPNQVVGATVNLKYEIKNGVPQLTRMPGMSFPDNGDGKPMGIYNNIGQTPIFTAGNSDGDYQMLQWTASSKAPHFEMIVHHTDSLREWKYDRNSPIGQLEKGLDDASKYGFTIVDMKNDWKIIYPFEKN